MSIGELFIHSHQNLDFRIRTTVCISQINHQALYIYTNVQNNTTLDSSCQLNTTILDPLTITISLTKYRHRLFY